MPITELAGLFVFVQCVRDDVFLQDYDVVGPNVVSPDLVGRTNYSPQSRARTTGSDGRRMNGVCKLTSMTHLNSRVYIIEHVCSGSELILQGTPRVEK